MENRFKAGVSSETLVTALELDGYAIVEDVLNEQELRVLRMQISPHLAATVPDAANGFMGERTLRCGRLLLRVPLTHRMVLDPHVIGALDGTLKKYGPTYQVHFTGVMHVMEGQNAQPIHQDAIPPFRNPALPMVIATMWAATDFTAENGATVFVPGSHRWPFDVSPRRSQLRQATMKAGSVLLYVGNLIHGAGSCTRGYRTGVALQYSVGWLRQEENQFLAVPLDVARTFSEPIQRIMGYDLAAKHWGYVDQCHPLAFLKGDDRPGGLAPEGYGFKDNVRELHVYEGGMHPGQQFEIIED